MLRKIASRGLDRLTDILYPLFHASLERELLEDYRSFGVEANNVCNARCSFCPYRLDYDKRGKGIVEDKVLEHSLKLLKKSGKCSFSFITILGDPFTDKDFLRKVALVKSEPQVTDINIYSNLIGLDNYNVDEVVTSGVTVLNVSTCLGGREMYARLFGVDKYEHVMANLMTLLEANKRHGNPVKITLLLRVDYPVKDHYDRAMVDKIKEYIPEEKFDILPEDMWDDYNGSVKRGEIPGGARFRENLRDKSVPCYALYRKIQCLYNGDLAVCSCRVGPELVTDSIFNYESLEEYWKGGKLAEFRARWRRGEIPKICRGCTHYDPYTSITKNMLKARIKNFAKTLVGRNK